MIHNVHIRTTQNIGDRVSGPWLYTRGLMTYHDLYGPLTWLKPGDHVVIGGGGLYSPRFNSHSKEVWRILKEVTGKRIVWGAGVNYWDESNFGRPEFKHDLVGLRDWGYEDVDWVPCASCLSGLFDLEWKRTRDVVVYQHYNYTVRCYGCPEMTNHVPPGETTHTYFRRVVEFLASAEVVVTASYHGAYWATLLGCRVLAVPVKTKLTTMRHEPEYVTPSDWPSHLDGGRVYPDALEECREANRAFERKVRELCRV